MKRTLLLVMIALLLLGGANFAENAAPVVTAQPDDNCAVTPFDIAGQGHYTIRGSGAGGAGLPSEYTPISLPDSSLIEQTTLGQTPVAILVIDDFRAFQGEEAHGRLVTDVVIGLVRSHPSYSNEPQEDRSDPVVWRWLPRTAPALLVVEVDTFGFNTAQLKDRVENAVNMIRDEYGINRIVVNMSFSVIPCTTSDYDVTAIKNERSMTANRVTISQQVANARRLPTMNVAQARSATEIADTAFTEASGTREVATALEGYFDDVSDLDPLLNYLEGLTGQNTWWNPRAPVLVVPVASAGNFGRDLDAFVPASWPEVIGVSASLEGSPWDSSNLGQVMAAGGFFELDDLYVIGTSFAAPVVSVNTAFYLTNNAVCAQTPLTLDTDTLLEDAATPRCNPGFGQ